jgi:O-antigen ligase
LSAAEPFAVRPPPVADRIRLALLWLTGVVSGFVMIEPAPYEFIVAVTMLVFVATGLTLRVSHLPLVFLMAFFSIGCALSLVPVAAEPKTIQWTAVTCFLAVTSVFFAMALTDDPMRHLDVLMRGYIVAAVLTSAIAVFAYFRLMPRAELFLGAGRAKATFKDPNVFGPFLILPALIVLQRIVFGHARDVVVGGTIALVIAAGLFLSFSRGAWGHFAASLAIMLALTYITMHSSKARLRIVVGVVLGGAVVAVFIAALMSLKGVGDLFAERANLVNYYDGGHLGRFGRHILGALMVLDYPNGIGPLQFRHYMPEDPHNSFLAAFMSGGWLGGIAYVALTLVVLVVGLRQAFVPTPWQRPYIAIYATFVGEVGESYIIDVQHWRHYFLIIGLIWGLVCVRRPAAVAAGETAPTDTALPAGRIAPA